MRRIQAIETGSAQAPLLKWLELHLDQIRLGVLDLRGRHGWLMTSQDYNELMKTLARVTDIAYVGTTADLPSEFVERFPWVLEAATPEERAAPSTIRVVIADEHRLVEDRESNPTSYHEFVESQNERGIELFGIHSADFESLNRTYGFGAYMTIWVDRYAIQLWPESGFVKARLILRTDQEFERVTRYLRQLRLAITGLQTYVARANR